MEGGLGDAVGLSCEPSFFPYINYCPVLLDGCVQFFASACFSFYDFPFQLFLGWKCVMNRITMNETFPHSRLEGEVETLPCC